MTSHVGMRWFKFDFQVQTPEDAAHWADADTRLPEPRRPLVKQEPDANGNAVPSKADESQIQEIARKFLRRCHELELEAVGITDHNFSQKTNCRDWFLTHLVEQNKSVANALERKPLHIFPGFEVDIGFHVLCLFEPARNARHIERVNKILTKLGLSEEGRFSSGKPLKLRFNQQNVALKTLLEVVQGEHKGIVIAAHADQNDGLLSDPSNKDDYQLRELMAVEVTSNPPTHRFAEIIKGNDSHWGRKNRPPAYVMSSDAKSLKFGTDGKIEGNCLGYRYTWVKMSSPSIESLRQAFLDPASRIFCLGSRPSDSQTHPRIKRISIVGAAFVENQEISFAEGLNCIIGGRGTGKSSILEYLRLALEINATADANLAHSIEEKRKQIFSTIDLDGSKLQVDFEAEGGVPDTLTFTPKTEDGPLWRIEGREVEDITTVVRQLHAQFFSQGELSSMTMHEGGQNQVLKLVDASSGNSMEELKSLEISTATRLTGLFYGKKNLEKLSLEIRAISQSIVELERQLLARKSVQADALANQNALRARSILEEIERITNQDGEKISAIIKEIKENSLPAPPNWDNWPESEWFKYVNSHIAGRRNHLAEQLQEFLNSYRDDIKLLLTPEKISAANAAIEDVRRNFRVVCEEKGLQVHDIARLEEFEELRQRKLVELEQKRKEYEEHEAIPPLVSEKLAVLHDTWKKQFELRTATSKIMQDAVASQTIRTTIRYMGDKGHFLEIWQSISPKDGRIKLARRWEEIGEGLYQSWMERGSEPSPWETVESGRTDQHAIRFLFGETAEDVLPALIQYIGSDNVREMWEEIRVTRVRDAIDVELMRDDGTSAGKMGAGLSEGQRNTVLLNLMLSRGSGPIIIDQPEDELDSNFIYKTLVKDLRATKQKRQMIIATHNANLPVNGDAELIYALETKGGKGKMLCQGGLDKPDVAQAVLEIMEGSEQAFKRRSDKYHF